MVSEYELFQSEKVIDRSTKQASRNNALGDKDGVTKEENKVAPDSEPKMETPATRSKKESSENASEHKTVKGSDGSGGRKSLDSETSKITSEKVAGHMTPNGKEESRVNETQTLEGGSTKGSSWKFTDNTTLKDKIEGIGRQDLIENIPVFQIGGPLVKKNDLIVRHCEDCRDCNSDRVVINLKMKGIINFK